MKRLGIFFFYEKNGDVDDFITYYLADLAKNLTDLVVVCNGKLSAQGRAAFSQFTDNIIIAANIHKKFFYHTIMLLKYYFSRPGKNFLIAHSLFEAFL